VASVEDIMTTEVVSVHYRQNVRHALAALYEHDIRQVPVVDDSGRVVAIVTDRDLREHVGPAASRDEDPDLRASSLHDPLEAVMTTDPTTLDPATDVTELIDLLIDTKFGGFPVVDHAGKLIGIVTYIDVLRAARELF
jgi:acetoin utilization protein AcuB